MTPSVLAGIILAAAAAGGFLLLVGLLIWEAIRRRKEGPCRTR